MLEQGDAKESAWVSEVRLHLLRFGSRPLLGLHHLLVDGGRLLGRFGRRLVPQPIPMRRPIEGRRKCVLHTGF